MRKQLKSTVALQVRFVSAQRKYSLQEFLDAKKFCHSKTPRNIKRLILKSKHAVSAQEIFLEILHISLAKSTEAINHFACEL